MLNYVRQFIKVRVVFYTLYILKADGDPHFFAFLAQLTYYLTAVKFFARMSSSETLIDSCLMLSRLLGPSKASYSEINCHRFSSPRTHRVVCL